MSIETASVIVNYTIIPFATALGISLTGFKIYDLLRNKNIKKHHTDLKILDLEKQLLEQQNRISILSDQLETVFQRTYGINKKLDDIIGSVKVLDNNLVEKMYRISPLPVTSPTQSHVSDPAMISSHLNHNIISQSQPQFQFNSFNKDDDRQNSTTEYILKKLEDKSLTTREIQRIVGRTREHTSRIMKKLFEDKYVVRDMNTKPFRYTITDEGRKLLIKHSVSKTLLPYSDPQNNENQLNDLIEK